MRCVNVTWSTKQRTSCLLDGAAQSCHLCNPSSCHHLLRVNLLTHHGPNMHNFSKLLFAPAVVCWIGRHIRNPPAVKMDKHDQVATAQHSAWNPRRFTLSETLFGFVLWVRGHPRRTQCPPLDRCLSVGLMLRLFSLEHVSQVE